MAAANPVDKWNQYTTAWKALHGKAKSLSSKEAGKLLSIVEEIDREIETLERDFKKSIKEAHEKGVVSAKLSEYRKNSKVESVLRGFDKKQVELKEAIVQLDAYCGECYKLVEDGQKKLSGLASHIKKNSDPPSSADTKTTKAFATARLGAEAALKEGEAMFKDLTEASKYRYKVGAYLREFMRPDRKEKIVDKLFETTLKKMKDKEGNAELPAPLKKNVKSSLDRAARLKKAIEKACAGIVDAYDVEVSGSAQEVLRPTDNQFKEFDKIIKEFEDEKRKFERSIKAKKSILELEETKKKLDEFLEDARDLVVKAEREIEKKKKKAKT